VINQLKKIRMMQQIGQLTKIRAKSSF